MAVVGNLMVLVGANTKPLQKGMKRGSSATRGMTDSMSILKKVIAGIGIATATAKVKGLVDQYFQFADKVSKFARNVGWASDAMFLLAYSSELAGVPAQSFDVLIRRLSAGIFDLSRGLSTSVEAFGKLGLSFATLDGLSPEAQFNLTIQALNNVEDASVRTGIAMKIFGRTGATVVGLAKFTDQLAAQREDLQKLGLVMGAGNVTAEEYQDTVTKLRFGFIALGKAILEYIGAGSIKEAGNEFIKFFAILKDQIGTIITLFRILAVVIIGKLVSASFGLITNKLVAMHAVASANSAKYIAASTARRDAEIKNIKAVGEVQNELHKKQIARQNALEARLGKARVDMHQGRVGFSESFYPDEGFSRKAVLSGTTHGGEENLQAVKDAQQFLRGKKATRAINKLLIAQEKKIDAVFKKGLSERKRAGRLMRRNARMADVFGKNFSKATDAVGGVAKKLAGGALLLGGWTIAVGVVWKLLKKVVGIFTENYEPPTWLVALGIVFKQITEAFSVGIEDATGAMAKMLGFTEKMEKLSPLQQTVQDAKELRGIFDDFVTGAADVETAFKNVTNATGDFINLSEEAFSLAVMDGSAALVVKSMDKQLASLRATKKGAVAYKQTLEELRKYSPQYFMDTGGSKKLADTKLQIAEQDMAIQKLAGNYTQLGNKMKNLPVSMLNGVVPTELTKRANDLKIELGLINKELKKASTFKMPEGNRKAAIFTFSKTSVADMIKLLTKGIADVEKDWLKEIERMRKVRDKGMLSQQDEVYLKKLEQRAAKLLAMRDRFTQEIADLLQLSTLLPNDLIGGDLTPLKEAADLYRHIKDDAEAIKALAAPTKAIASAGSLAKAIIKSEGLEKQYGDMAVKMGEKLKAELAKGNTNWEMIDKWELELGLVLEKLAKVRAETVKLYELEGKVGKTLAGDMLLTKKGKIKEIERLITEKEKRLQEIEAAGEKAKALAAAVSFTPALVKGTAAEYSARINFDEQKNAQDRLEAINEDIACATSATAAEIIRLRNDLKTANTVTF